MNEDSESEDEEGEGEGEGELYGGWGGGRRAALRDLLYVKHVI